MKASYSILSLTFLLIQICVSRVLEEERSDLNNSNNLNKSTLKKENANYKAFNLDENVDNLNDNLDNNIEDSKRVKDHLESSENKKIPKDKLNPIVLIPGLEGSRLSATLNKTKSGHYYCRKNQKVPFTIWINLEEFIIPIVNCFVENMRLHYNNETRKTSNTEGVQVQVPGFGSTESIETLVGNRFVPQFYYYKYVVDTLVDLGYQRNVSLRGAPFDFR